MRGGCQRRACFGGWCGDAASRARQLLRSLTFHFAACRFKDCTFCRRSTSRASSRSSSARSTPGCAHRSSGSGSAAPAPAEPTIVPQQPTLSHQSKTRCVVECLAWASLGPLSAGQRQSARVGVFQIRISGLKKWGRRRSEGIFQWMLKAHRCLMLGCVWLQYWVLIRRNNPCVGACVRACPPCQSALLLRLYDFLATMLRSLVFRLVLP